MTTTVNNSLVILGARLRGVGSRDQSASALLVRNGRIAAIGSDEDIRATAPASTRIVDAAGGTVTPGLFDSHTHPHWAVSITNGVDLGGVGSLDELRAALRAEADRVGRAGWVRGWNLEFEAFEGMGVDRALIEDAVYGLPTVLIFYDLHSALVTAAALAAAKITGPRDFADASEIVTDSTGRPTGELREPTAYKLATDAAPPFSHEEERERLRDQFRRFNQVGITGGAIMDGNPRTVELLRELEDRGELTARMTVHQWHAADTTDSEMAETIAQRDSRGRLWQQGAIKLFSDGVIDTGTAWLHEPDTCGQSLVGFWPDWERFRYVVGRYHEAGFLIATHAVGDQAVSRVLDVYAGLPPRGPELPRHSIEHLEVLGDDDVSRLGASGVTASMQPLHMQWRSPDGSDTWARRLGEDRLHNGYRVRDVLNSKGRLVLGSDWPVAQYDPRIGMAWARGRRDPLAASAHVFEPDQRLSGEEALAAYTIWPALARAHDDRGRVEVGAVADLTVFAGDPVTVPAENLPELPVTHTIVDGDVVHCA